MIVIFPNDLIARPEHHTRDRSIGMLVSGGLPSRITGVCDTCGSESSLHGVPHDDFSMSWTHLGEPPQVGDRFILARAPEEG